jgi:hypothetical protein
MSFTIPEIHAIKRARIIHSLDKEAPPLSNHILLNIEAQIGGRDAYETQVPAASWERFNLIDNERQSIGREI